MKEQSLNKLKMNQIKKSQIIKNLNIKTSIKKLKNINIKKHYVYHLLLLFIIFIINVLSNIRFSIK